ncbi:hypothetical protein B0F90DRAFT_1816801 [Multifurca ochricompacta]|uniref:Fe2OG dioxygenase domain-containing protein n=1 Tax=Multifurca ochricompacta TaxID=376703 RepID=A0AAD4QP74_9AGAM|nr:hypothetical protein B0F90DRAFT_1816801 [Multifurca ochricompacta]
MPGVSLPPFPDDLPTVPLLVIDYALLQAGDEHEIQSLWKAATELGFWYLKNHGADAAVNAMFEMGARTMKLPLEEKMKFEQGDRGISFGYKFAGANATDASGALDSVEFINVSKDDALAYPTVVHRRYPSTVEDYMESAVRPFVSKGMEVNETLMGILNDRLGLPPRTLAGLHTPEEHSGSEARCIKKTPESQPESPDKPAIGAHTDFGSLSFLHNQLGGLQVLPPGTNEWKYVKPLPGHAICNLGDAMAIFSAGILRSNLHRVVPPPKAQALFDRWSLVYFTRPGNSVSLAPLTDKSSLVAEAAVRASENQYATNVTAAEWFARRIQNQRIKNRKGPETWMASRGTEHKREAN